MGKHFGTQKWLFLKGFPLVTKPGQPSDLSALLFICLSISRSPLNNIEACWPTPTAFDKWQIQTNSDPTGFMQNW